MRYLFILLFFFVSSGSFAQSYDRITLSKFDKPNDLALLDTVKQLLKTGGYGKFISSEQEVYNKSAKTNDFNSVKSLLKKLSSNGTDDISKCFYPRHSVNFYQGNAIVKYVLICFECEGLRFSDERWITNEKDENKQIKVMNELKEEFTKEALVN